MPIPRNRYVRVTREVFLRDIFNSVRVFAETLVIEINGRINTIEFDSDRDLFIHFTHKGNGLLIPKSASITKINTNNFKGIIKYRVEFVSGYSPDNYLYLTLYKEGYFDEQ